MTTYRLRKGCGRHSCANGHVITQDNPIYETDEPLQKMFADKFEVVSGHTDAEGHAFGTVVTEDFPLAETIPQCVVWKKGRRYRITVDGTAVATDPTRLSNEDEVNLQLKRLLKSIHHGEVEDDEPLEEEEEVEDDDDDAEEVEEEVVKPVKKKKRRS